MDVLASAFESNTFLPDFVAQFNELLDQGAQARRQGSYANNDTSSLQTSLDEAWNRTNTLEGETSPDATSLPDDDLIRRAIDDAEQRARLEDMAINPNNEQSLFTGASVPLERIEEAFLSRGAPDILREIFAFSPTQSLVIPKAADLLEESLAALERIRELSLSLRAALARSGQYDVIVVGGGTSGAVSAEILAKGGLDVLLIERGVDRLDPNAVNARNIYGAGTVIDDLRVTAPVVTSQGVITHYANGVLGGGGAVNMGITLLDNFEYWDYLEKTYGWTITEDDINEAFSWLAPKVAFASPQDTTYGTRLAAAVGVNYGPRMAAINPQRGTVRYDTGSSWLGSTSFRSDGDYFRHSADVVLTEPKLLLQTSAKRIRFDTGEDNLPRARCVEFRPIQASNNLFNKIIDTVPTSLFGSAMQLAPFAQIKAFLDRMRAIIDRPRLGLMDVQSDAEVCVRAGGRIIVASGALMTPTLMRNSGITGFKEDSETGETLVVNEKIGAHASDRLYIPVGIFMKEDQNTYNTPRVCESIGMSDDESCQIGNRFDWLGDGTSDRCSFAGVESLGGGDIILGTTFATRFLLPPAIRNHVLVQIFFELFKKCDRNEPMFNLGYVMNAAICPTLIPALECIRRMRSNFYVQTQPVARHKLLMDVDDSGLGLGSKGRSWKLSGIDSNYLENEEDLANAVDGVRKVLKNLSFYEGIAEPFERIDGTPSCSIRFLNGLMLVGQRLFEMLVVVKAAEQSLQWAVAQTSLGGVPDAKNPISAEWMKAAKAIMKAKTGAVGEVIDRLLKPHKFFSEVADHLSDRIVSGELDFIMEKTKLSDLQNISSLVFEGRRLDASNWEERPLMGVMGMLENLYGVTFLSTVSKERRLDDLVDDEILQYLQYWDVKTGQASVMSGQSFLTSKPQFATFPPLLPPAMAADSRIEHYCKTYFTSIWHWTSSFPAGADLSFPVDPVDFSVRGVDNLHIVDASVIPMLPRLNPNFQVGLTGYIAAKRVLSVMGVS